MTLPVTAADIRAAHGRIASYVRHTPLLDSAPLTPGLPVSLKLEFLQHAGSFKPRGAFNNLLSRTIPAAGVTAASGGNHPSDGNSARKQVVKRAARLERAGVLEKFKLERDR